MGEDEIAPGDRAAQRDRRHILLVSRDLALLDLAHHLLQDERYNLTTTGTGPLTFALIAAARPRC